MTDINEYNDDFYCVEISQHEINGGRWEVRASAIRKDSGEVVGGIAQIDKSSMMALLRLQERISGYFSSLPRPPYEWGRTELRGLLADYLKFNNELTLMLVRLEKMRITNQLTEEALHDGFWMAREKAIKGAVSLSQRLSALPEKDLIDLMTSPAEAYINPENPWYLDDLKSRAALFHFIPSPSELVKKAHESHQLR